MVVNSLSQDAVAPDSRRSEADTAGQADTAGATLSGPAPSFPPLCGWPWVPGPSPAPRPRRWLGALAREFGAAGVCWVLAFSRPLGGR